MQSGFNTNIRHRGVLFHVQTEDSGRANPHVISHLFHGGNIMASEKRDYSAELDSESLEDVVRRLMESQHKALLRQLRAGDHDAVIQLRLGADVFGGEDPSDTAATLPPESPTQPGVGGPAPRSAPDAAAPASSRGFGERVVTDKPLDEVVLDFLVESARKRKRQAK